MANLRLALRMLLKTPVVTTVAVASLALGIGANAAIFSLLSQVLLRPLPVVAPDRLVNLEAPGPKPGSDTCNQAGGCDEVFSYPMYRDLQSDQKVFTDIAAHRPFGIAVRHDGQTISGQGVQVSGSYFSLLGLSPALGRLLGPEIDQPVGGHPVVVLSHDFWQSRLNGKPDVVGDLMLVNGLPMTVVGVAPAGFRGTTLGVRPLVFVPITMLSSLSAAEVEIFENRSYYWVYLFARLNPDVSIAQARAALEPTYQNILVGVEASLQTEMSQQTMARFISKPLPIEDGRRGQSSMDEATGAPLLLLFGVTAMVVLIACANIANLLLARAAVREPEMAVRLSIGAARRHLLVQLLTESCLLALLGGVAGLVFARWTLGFIGTLLPPETRDTIQLTVDPSMMLFALCLALATGLFFGIVPALHSTRAELISTLKGQAGQPAGARTAARFRTGLVVAQVALSLTLLVGAGLFIESLYNVSQVELGIETENVVTFRLSPARNGYNDEQSRQLYRRVEEVMAVQPGVTSVTAASVAVLGGDSWGTNVMVQGFDAGPDTDRNSRWNRIGTDFFRTLGVQLLAGRTFLESDEFESSKVVIVNQTFARRFGLDDDAVGRRMGRGGLDADLDLEIVGLVRDTTYNDVKNGEPPLFYIPYRQEENVGSLTFYIRSSIPTDALLPTIPTLVTQLDSNVPVNDLKTIPQQVREDISTDRLLSLLSAAFAVLATLLAAVGLYGVLAYTVAQRTREIGLRMALGADATRIRNMVLGHVGRITLVGGGIGLVAAFGLGRLAQSMLYEIDGVRPGVLVVASLGLGVVALLAGFIPAHRASRLNPIVALKYK